MIGSLMKFQQWSLVDIPSLLGPRFERINIFYSSPEYYTDWKYQQTRIQKVSREDDIRQSTADSVQWSTKTDDFFPYSDCPHCFWAGYYTSRSAFKRFERASSAFLMAARQIEAFPEPDAATMDCDYDCDCDQPLFALEDASGIVQHHDAVSGTAKQHVANDYSKRLQAGMDQAAAFVVSKLRRLLVGNSNSTALSNLSYCQLINETICEVSQVSGWSCGGIIWILQHCRI
jgi:alpha-mannosidase